MTRMNRGRKRCPNCEQGIPIEKAPPREDTDYRLTTHSARGTDSVCLGTFKPVDLDDAAS